MSQARRLGLAQGKTLVVDSMDDLNLAFDLVIHTASKDRSRAIDRYARAAKLAPEFRRVIVLEAMRRARFSIISFVRRHPVAGLIVKDVFRDDDVWLVDEGLETSFGWRWAGHSALHARTLRYDGRRHGAAGPRNRLPTRLKIHRNCSARISRSDRRPPFRGGDLSRCPCEGADGAVAYQDPIAKSD